MVRLCSSGFLYTASRTLCVAILVPLLVLNQPARADDTAISLELEKILALPEDKIDIGTAALTFAHEVFPNDTDIQAYSGQIDKFVKEVKDLQAAAQAQHLPGIPDEPLATILAIHEVLYNREGFKYDQTEDSIRNIQNQFLPGILERKVGNCTNMPMLYMAVAQRLGLHVYAAEAPQHLFVRIVTGTGAAAKVINIETTSGGLPTRDVWYTEKEHINPAAIERGTYMRTLTHHQYLAVLLASNGNIWLQRGQFDKAVAYYKRAMQIDPKNPFPVLDVMDLYINKFLKEQDDYIFALNDADRKHAEEDFRQAIFYRKQVRDMGVNLGDYVHDNKSGAEKTE